jgi:Arc/MetJ family transcription regulator
MRTNIVIRDDLMKTAMELTKAKSKREVVEQALESLIRLKKQEELRSLRGRLHWEGDLEAMRRDT